MIFAKVDVTLSQHHRVLRIPIGIRAECVGVWLLSLLWTRGNERDGFCPLEAIDRVAKPKIIGELVRVGLFSEEVDLDGVPGIKVLRYEEHNETKLQIDSRKEQDRLRKKGAPKAPPSGRIPDGIHPESSGIPIESVAGRRGSDSVSVLGSDLREGIRGEFSRPPSDIPLTEELLANCAMAGTRVPTKTDVVACLSNARTKGHTSADWPSELVKWMVRGKQHFDRPEPKAPPSRKPLHLPPKVHNG